MNKLLCGELETALTKHYQQHPSCSGQCPYNELETLHSCETKQHPATEAQAVLHVMLDKNGNLNIYYKMSSTWEIHSLLDLVVIYGWRYVTS